jgi:hypothetical protein
MKILDLQLPFKSKIRSKPTIFNENEFRVGIEVNLNTPTGNKPFFEERAKRLQRKARPAGKRPQNNQNDRKKLENQQHSMLFGKDNIHT